MWDLVPWPGIEPGSPAKGAQSLSHWTSREVPGFAILWGFKLEAAFSSCIHHKVRTAQTHAVGRSIALGRMYMALLCRYSSRKSLDLGAEGAWLWSKAMAPITLGTRGSALPPVVLEKRRAYMITPLFYCPALTSVGNRTGKDGSLAFSPDIMESIVFVYLACLSFLW